MTGQSACSLLGHVIQCLLHQVKGFFMPCQRVNVVMSKCFLLYQDSVFRVSGHRDFFVAGQRVYKCVRLDV